MKCARVSIWRDESGLLTQEWVFLLAVCVIGIVTGVGALRDAVSVSFFRGSQAIGAVDPAYTISDYQGNGYTAKGSTYKGGEVSTSVDMYQK